MFLLLFSLLLLMFFLELSDVFGQKWEEIPFAKRENIGCTVDYAEGRNRYMQHLIALGTSFHGMRVGLDCANGSSWNMAKWLYLKAAVFPEYDMMKNKPYCGYLKSWRFLLPVAWMQRLIIEGTQKTMRERVKRQLSNKMINQQVEYYKKWGLYD